MKWCALITVAAITVAPAAARAGEPTPPSVIPQKARALADRGRLFHDAGDYGNAIVAFKEAYVMAPSPGLLFNLAQAYRLQGSCDDAALMYQRYLATDPASERRVIAEGHLDTVERCRHKARLSLHPDASLGELPIPPAPSSDGSLQFTPRETRRTAIQKNVGVGLTIGGGVALAIAGYYALDALDAAAEIEAAYTSGARWRDVQHIDARGESSATNARILGVGGALAIAGGVTLYLLGKRAERIAPIAIVPSTRGAEVSAAWRF